MLYIKVYVVGKSWCEYEPNQKSDDAVNPGFITSKTSINSACYNMLGGSSSKQRALLIKAASSFSSLLYMKF